ncbi:MAG: O-antigen ligase family protein [Candidatus Omnitrophica bacterium]|nr:O-antigen ligase family protein [Candidatus Omnitrophota bacterium]
MADLSQFFAQFYILALVITAFLMIAVLALFFTRGYGFANALIPLNGIQRYSLAIGFALKPYLIFSILLFGRMLLIKDLRQRINRVLTIARPGIIPLIGLMASFLISGIFTGNSTESIRNYLLIAWHLAIVAAYLVYIQEEKDIALTNRVITITGVAYAIIGISSFTLFMSGLTKIASGREDAGMLYLYSTDIVARLRAFEWDSLAYGNYILPLLFCIIGITLSRIIKGQKSVYYICASLLLVAHLVLTFSRGIAFSFLAGILFLTLHIPQKIIKRLIGLRSILLITLFSAAFIPFLGFIIKGFTYRSAFMASRGTLWNQSYDLMSRHIWWGVGQGRITEYITKQAHNSWFELGAENGIFALIFAIWFFGVTIYRGSSAAKWLLARSDPRGFIVLGFTTGLFAMTIMLFFISDFFKIYFWLQAGLVGLVTAVYRPEKEAIP